MTVDSITVLSPTNSYNTLLLNYAGTQTPLTAQSLSVGSNSAFTLLSSALQVGSDLHAGGVINQNDSLVTGNLVDVGDIGPGVYNLNSGILDVSQLWVDSTFNQNGGTNAAPTSVSGDYNMNGGYAESIYIGGGTLRQNGGTLDSSLGNSGNYVLEGGVHNGGLTDLGMVLQTGGTNIGNLTIGYVDYLSQRSSAGSYTISNGLCSGGIDIEGNGTFTQEGGMVAANTVTLRSMFFVEKGGGETLSASLLQNGGTLSCSQMVVDGYYRQTGGTNFVAGTLSSSDLGSIFTSGWLCASNIEIAYNIGSSFGGTVIVSNEFSVFSGCSGGGHLVASNITLAGGTFSFGPGTIDQTGILALSGGGFRFYGPGAFNLGRLVPSAGANFQLSSANGCTLRFADSSALPWATNSVVNFQNWSGSLYGGGNQRIIFGINSAALMAQQLSQIQFQNPAGLAAGNYPARILSTGEIVPDTGAPLALKMTAASPSSNGWMQLSVGADIGRSYDIEVSTDLVNWSRWTNEFNSNGTIYLHDQEAPKHPQRFYRTRPVP